jgi:hypothetical protein
MINAIFDDDILGQCKNYLDFTLTLINSLINSI